MGVNREREREREVVLLRDGDITARLEHTAASGHLEAPYAPMGTLCFLVNRHVLGRKAKAAALVVACRWPPPVKSIPVKRTVRWVQPAV